MHSYPNMGISDIAKKKMDEKDFFVVLLFLSLYTVSASVSLQYCWQGSDDDIESLRNMSCVTGEVSLANSFSQKVAAGSENVSDTLEHVSHYCIAFKTESTSLVNNVTVTTSAAVFSCDSEHLCKGKNMMEGYQVSYNGKQGLLYCCNSENNCNQASLTSYEEHEHSCFSTHTSEPEVCQRKDTPCVRVTMMKLSNTDLTLKQLSKEYSCDSKGLCDANNLTGTTSISCDKTSDHDTNIDTETCCCHGDNCFNPNWLPAGSAVNVQQTEDGPQNAWQRTMLIIIGVALGIIVVGCTLYFIVRSRRSKSGDSPHHGHGMKYLSVSHSTSNHGNHDGDDEDNVHILPRS